jgi:hypothetical protein
MSSDGILRIYTVYDHPADFPKDYVVRVWEMRGGEPHKTNEGHRSPDLDIVRSWIEWHAHRYGVGVVRIERDANDDPVILENWI